MTNRGPVVVIDDDRDDQELFLEVLTHFGLKDFIRQFEDCPSALHYLETTPERPFLILCDINLPGMNGLEFRKRLNKNDFLRMKSIPFVFLSTAAVQAQVQEAYELTVQGFFIKQNSMAAMQDVFKRLLDYWKDCVHPNSF
ncbi:response regulator [Chryseolinea sp. Jin1]|uniref:Response regulator n=1 Tax=Chryseolinea lacunae TaxID=2801331 RepID=A0ABS1KNP4_9BACT|nr:response regulator [Chryseolinea lacunae]